jgi:hypothetical protein
MPYRTGGEAVLEALIAQGIEVLFVLPGVQNDAEVRVAGVVRRRHDHLVAGLEQQRDDQQQGGRGSARHEHPLRVDRDAGAPRLVGGDGLAQRGQAAAVGVVGLAPGQRRAAGFDRFRRRREVGLPDLEVDHRGPGPLHGVRLLEHLLGEEGLDGPNALGDPHGVRSSRER